MPPARISVDIASHQKTLRLDRRQLVETVNMVLQGEGFSRGHISLAVLDDQAIHQLNRQYLKHDYPTDVLSFPLEREGTHLEGEIIVSAETAVRQAREYGWSSRAEMLLYFVHGLLHLCGYDDHDPAEKVKMRERERHYMAKLGHPMADESTAGR